MTKARDQRRTDPVKISFRFNRIPRNSGVFPTIVRPPESFPKALRAPSPAAGIAQIPGVIAMRFAWRLKCCDALPRGFVDVGRGGAAFFLKRTNQLRDERRYRFLVLGVDHRSDRPVDP